MIDTDDMPVLTIDGWLRDFGQAYVTRTLRQLAEELDLVEVLFPVPIAERIHRRDGRALRRYRGEHRKGAWSVCDLVVAVESQREATRRAHIRSLRRPTEPMVYLGSRPVTFRLWHPADPSDPEAMLATVDVEPEGRIMLSIPAIQGPPAEPFAWDDANTGPILAPPPVTIDGVEVTPNDPLPLHMPDTPTEGAWCSPFAEGPGSGPPAANGVYTVSGGD